MHLFRFYLPLDLIRKSPIKITGTDAHHALNVLRLKQGDSVIIFDGVEAEYTAEITSIKQNELILSSPKELRKERRYKPAIGLYSALIPEFDDVVHASVELGVSKIYPMVTEKTQVRIPRGSYRKKIERWNRIAISASMQCGRIVLPEISEPVSFCDALNISKAREFGLIASLEKGSKSILDVLNDPMRDLHSVSIFIGPPADFSETELLSARDAGVIPVRIMQNTLRSETAALSALAVINSFFYTRSLK